LVLPPPSAPADCGSARPGPLGGALAPRGARPFRSRIRFKTSQVQVGADQTVFYLDGDRLPEA